MIDKMQLMRSGREYGRTERVHLTALTDAEKDIYISNRFPENFKGNEYLEMYVNTVWEVANSDSVLTFCIWDNATNEYLGYCNYNKLDKEVTAIGIELNPKSQSKGLGYEVCKYLIRNYFECTEAPYLYYEATRMNECSRNLGEKLGGVLQEVKALLPSLEEMNAELPEDKRIDCSSLDIFTYVIYRPE